MHIRSVTGDESVMTGKRGSSESAASEAIGAVMLISVVVLAVAIIGVVLTSQGTPQKLPAVSAIISSSGSQISIYHDGGDSLSSNELSILVNGTEVKFKKGGNPPPWTWSVGDTISYDLGSTTLRTVRIVYTPGSYTIASADFGEMETGPVTTGPTPSTTTAPPSPTVSGINPLKGNTGTTTGITSISGTNFVSGATVRLTRSGSGDIPVSGITVVSPAQITGGSINLAGASVGQWNVVVTNPDAQSGILPNGFEVTNAAPAITGITPATGSRDTIVTITDLAGTNFMNGATVRLNRTDSTAIPATSVIVVSPGQITCQITLTSGTTTGSWDVIVRNPDGQEGTLANGFAVTRPSPTVTAILPPAASQNVNLPVSIAGTGFITGANVTLRRSGYTEIIASSVDVHSSNLVTCQFNTFTAQPGAWDVVVTNTDGTSGSLPGGFTVLLPAPSISGFSPATANRGWTISSTINGANFRSGATVRLNRTGQPDIVATGVTVPSSATIGCSINLAGAQAGQWNVVVQNTDGQEAIRANAITVNAPAPVLSTRSPTSADRGWPATVSFTGSGFQPGANISLTRTGQPNIVGTGVTVTSPTQISALFNLRDVYVSGGTTGTSTWNVVVTNTDGQTVTRTNWFTVNSRAPTIPSSPSFSPSSGVRGSTVTITAPGSYLQPGMAVVLTRSSTTITAYNVNIASPTSVTFTINIPPGAATGGYTARYTNTDGRTVTRTNRFQVT